MVLLLLAAVTAALPMRDPLAPYRDKPIVAVDIEAPAGEQVDELKRLVGVAPGYLLSSSAITAAIKRLYALGRFSQVDLYIEPQGDAVWLHFVLKHVHQLAGLSVLGLSQVKEEALLAALRLPPGSDVDRRTPELLRQRSLAYLARVGFPHAEVTVDQYAVSDDLIQVTLLVREGPTRRVGAINFAGTPGVGPNVLSGLIHTQKDGILDLDQVERDRERILQAYLQRGFAHVVVDRAQIVGDDVTATVTFTVTAGKRVAFHFVGNHALRDDQIKMLWPNSDRSLQPGDLEVYGERIAEAYRRLGYFRITVQGNGITDRDQIERYIFRINEGPRPVVDDISFTGATAFPERLLVRQVENTLIQELGGDGSFQPLSRAELAAANSEATSVPSELPPAHRFVESLYGKAAADIAAAYHDRGYLRATVGPPRLTIREKRATVTIPIHEGPQTRVATLAFANNQALSNSDLEAILKETATRKLDTKDTSASPPLPNAPLSSAGVEEARIAVVRKYRDSGYLYARVFSDVNLRPDGKTADVVLRSEEGPEVRIDTLIVRGNRYTSSDLIKSRLTLQPGEPYRLSQALQDQRNIDALGVFSSVRVRLVDEETPAERKDVVAEVVERKRQAFELWPGVSTADGPRLRLNYSHLNLAGTATGLNLSLKLNWKMFFGFYGDYADTLATRYESFTLRERTEIEARAGIRSPRFTMYPAETSARFDLVGERHNAISYSLDAARAIFGIDLLAFDRLGVTVEPQFALTNLTCFAGSVASTSGDCQTALLNSTPDRRRVDAGLRAEFKVGPSITLDLRDNALDPRRGFLANARAIYGVGAALSPESMQSATDVTSNDWIPITYTLIEASLSGYIPVGPTVLALSARGGTVVRGTLPLDERFYLGGSTSMRGFQETAMLPDDVCVLTDTSATPESLPSHCVWRNRAYTQTVDGKLVLPLPTGGDHFAQLKAEWRIYLSRSILFSIFVDAGNLWLTRVAWRNMRLRINPGAGLRYSTPAGPIGVDLGFIPDADPLRSESLYSLQFAVGVF